LDLEAFLDFDTKTFSNRSKKTNRSEIDFYYTRMYNKFQNDPNTKERPIFPQRGTMGRKLILFEFCLAAVNNGFM
jgi:hypothetical protein